MLQSIMFCVNSFPLFGKGKEKFQFDYGVYILNKNIAQVMCNISYRWK